MGLDDAILIKENHIALAGGPGRGGASGSRGGSRSARSRSSAATPDEAAEALGAGADRLLLDNMDAGRAAAAVAARDAAARRAAAGPSWRPPAASPSTTVAEIAATGVDSISVGALTHSAPALDLSMLLEPA